MKLPYYTRQLPAVNYFLCDFFLLKHIITAAPAPIIITAETITIIYGTAELPRVSDFVSPFAGFPSLPVGIITISSK